MFFGKTDHNIDDKGRLALPAKLRQSIKGRIFLNVDITTEYLELVMLETHKKTQEFLNSFDEFNLDAKKIKIFLNAQTYEVKLDSLGRINIPHQILKETKLGKQVTVIGNGDRIVIWNQASYEKNFQAQKPNMIKLAQKLTEQKNGK